MLKKFDLNQVNVFKQQQEEEKKKIFSLFLKRTKYIKKSGDDSKVLHCFWQ